MLLKQCVKYIHINSWLIWGQFWPFWFYDIFGPNSSLKEAQKLNFPSTSQCVTILGVGQLFYSHLFCVFPEGFQVFHSLCSFSMCFLRLSLVLATFPHSEQETWVLAICLASMCLLTSHFFPDIPHSTHWRDPSMPITRYWSIALSSSVAIPRNTFCKSIKGQTRTQGKVCSKYLFRSSHVTHISIFSGFYVHLTCECQRGPCCRNWVHTGDM